MKQLRQTLYIMTPERYLSLDGENVVVQEKKMILARLPLHNLDGIICFGAAGASPPLMGKCAEMGLPISFLSRSGKFLCRTEGTISGNVLLRRQQYRLADQASERLKIAKSMITGKIFNSRYVLERRRSQNFCEQQHNEHGKHLIWILCVALKGKQHLFIFLYGMI